jgi:hypothetical protein
MLTLESLTVMLFQLDVRLDLAQRLRSGKTSLLLLAAQCQHLTLFSQ